MFLVHKTNRFILKNIILFIFPIVFISSFFISSSYAQTEENYVVISGIDKSSGIAKDFTPSEIERLGVSDSELGSGIDRVRSDKWPDAGVYDPERYIEFIFSPDLPTDVTISEVKVTHEFQRSAALEGAKIEIWDGDSFVEHPGVTLGSSGEDHTDVIDVTSILDTPDKINNTKIRFLAYRASPTASGTTTGHDFFGLSVTYSISPPEEQDIPEEEPDVSEFTKISSDITEDTILTKDNSPYVISQSISVLEGAELTIEAGVIIKSEPDVEINISGGSLKALGTSDNKIYFTNLTDDNSNSWNGISISNTLDNPAHLFLENVVIHYAYSGLRLGNISDVIINNVIFEKNGSGISDSGGTIVNITDSKIINNSIGIELNQESGAQNSVYNISNLSIYGNSDYGVSNNTYSLAKNQNSVLNLLASLFKPNQVFAEEYDYTVDFRNVWWGDSSGPLHEFTNIGGLGNKVSDNVLFDPWVTIDPEIPPLPVRNPVIIIPGVMGTEISSNLEKLWVDLTHNLADIGDEFMDPLQFNDDLTPSVEGLMVGDVLRKVFISLNFKDVTIFDYTEGLIKEFQNQGYTEGTDLFLFPYDWRYGVSDDTVLKLKQKITDILVQTEAEKVDIVAHSTGGLIVKKYVVENPIEHFIDKAIFVGVPNTGAPQAIKNFLEGSNFNNPFLDQKEMKKLARNLPVAYDLSPSEQYFNVKGSFIKIINQDTLSSTSDDLNFEEVNDFLIKDHNLNNQALEKANTLHTFDFDNYDLRTNDVDLYSINGCKAGTLGKIIERRYVTDTKYLYQIKNVPGDGTVPLESATNLPINEEHKYFALKTEHSEMLSDNGIRQQIVNIISGSNLETKNISQDIAKCKLKGRAIAVYSPVSIDVTDQDGNHLGLSYDGVGIENNIPNAFFEIIGEEKFLYLPDDEGQTYIITLHSIENGLFTITDTKIEDNTEVEMQVFRDIDITKLFTGKFTLGEVSTLELDIDNDGIFDQNLRPIILDASNLIDFDPTHKVAPEPEPAIVIPNNPVVVYSSSGGSGYPAPPVVIAQHSESESPKNEEIIVQKEKEIILNEEPVKNIPKTKIIPKIADISDISSEKEIIHQLIDTADISETEIKEQDKEINLQASALSSGLNIKPSIPLIIFLSIVGILLLVRKFIKSKNYE